MSGGDDVVNILQLPDDTDVDMRFFHDPEDSRKVNPGEWEVGHVFLRLERQMLSGDKLWDARAVFSSPGTGEWQAYIFEGDWAYGSSAERFEVRLSSVTAGGE